MPILALMSNTNEETNMSSTYLRGKNTHHTYLKRYFAETTKVDHSEEILVDGAGEVICAVMTYGEVIKLIMGAPMNEQASVAAMVRKIDFANGDVCHYLRHLATCFVRTQAGA